jgi:hypothetical protein
MTDGQLSFSLPLPDACTEGHVFRPPRDEPPGACQRCGLDTVDWARLHRRDSADWQYALTWLQNEQLRRPQWEGPIDDRAVERYHKTHGRLRELVQRRLRQSVGKVYGSGPGARPYRDGYQTPTHGDIIFYAQHALACCCRRCIRYWHGIPYGRNLSDDEIGYFADLILRFVAYRMDQAGAVSSLEAADAQPRGTQEPD